MSSPASLHPREIELSSQSTTFNITVEKQYRRKFNKVDEFLSNSNNTKLSTTTKEIEQKIPKRWQQNKPILSRLLKYLVINKNKSNMNKNKTETKYKNHQ